MRSLFGDGDDGLPSDRRMAPGEAPWTDACGDVLVDDRTALADAVGPDARRAHALVGLDVHGGALRHGGGRPGAARGHLFVVVEEVHERNLALGEPLGLVADGLEQPGEGRGRRTLAQPQTRFERVGLPPVLGASWRW